MSVVTNCILALSVQDEGMIPRINDFFDLRHFVDIEDAGWYGGGKHLEVCVCFASINYLDLPGLIKHIRGLRFELEEGVQLIVMEEDDNAFRIIDIFKEPPLYQQRRLLKCITCGHRFIKVAGGDRPVTDADFKPHTCASCTLKLEEQQE